MDKHETNSDEWAAKAVRQFLARVFRVLAEDLERTAMELRRWE